MKKKLVPTRDRPTTSISMRIPVDLLDKLKRLAPLKGMAGYQSLIKYYIGQGMLEDIDLVRRIEEEDARLDAILKKIGVAPQQIQEFWKEWAAYPVKNAAEEQDAPRGRQTDAQSRTNVPLSE